MHEHNHRMNVSEFILDAVAVMFPQLLSRVEFLRVHEELLSTRLRNLIGGGNLVFWSMISGVTRLPENTIFIDEANQEAEPILPLDQLP